MKEEVCLKDWKEGVKEEVKLKNWKRKEFAAGGVVEG